jgi:uncharacterized tellurite resistance protein B-like protein
VLATILRRLGIDVDVEESGSGTSALDTIADALEHMDPAEARQTAAFAYLLSRVAHADHDVTESERESMERMLIDRIGLEPERAAIVATLATSHLIHARGTEDYAVTREFGLAASPDEKRELVDAMFAVCAADSSIITVEDNEIRRVANGIGIEHADFVTIRNRYRDRLAVLKRDEEA